MSDNINANKISTGIDIPVSQPISSSTPLTTNGTGTNTTTSIFSSKVFKYFIIILIISILGFNLFNYLGKITQYLTDIFGPTFKTIAGFLGIAVGETTKTSLDVTSKGTSAVSGSLISGINVLESKLAKGISKNNIDSENENRSLYSNSTKPTPTSDDMESTIQNNKSINKSGFCYIGTDNGLRHCVKVTESDKCMSGNIFPTKEICINPNLRE
jgi:hypothetical protein